ncbi:hypothetical protein [Methylotuvimicrobium sp. KM2]|uniref:hypothetical protein n=1 Tax=Methylotuvimicrobium sp. KM2 TaxID=3133976 RepID=UPI003100FF0A
MKNSIVTSIDAVLVLESRNKKYLKSVLIGLQLGILFLPMELVREIFFPFFSGLYYIGLAVYGAVEDVFKGASIFWHA